MTALLVLLILLLIFVTPHWPYSAGWGYTPVGGVIIVILILLVLGYIG